MTKEGLLEIVLTQQNRDLSAKDYSNSDTKTPKAISAFLVKISELLPHVVLRQMTLLIRLMDCEVIHISSLRYFNT